MGIGFASLLRPANHLYGKTPYAFFPYFEKRWAGYGRIVRGLRICILGHGKKMKAMAIMAAAIILTASTSASAETKYLERIESQVFETTGDHQALTKRALTCIAQIVKPGFTNAPTILSSDIDSGVIVANNSFEYAAIFKH